ncbi:MAG: hypothetical protein AAFU41_00740 [Pseudomonadota bacterium]
MDSKKSQSELWGNIIDHDGGQCPLQPGQYVRVWMDNGRHYDGVIISADGDGWDWAGPACSQTLAFVLAYQLPRAEAVSRMAAQAIAEVLGKVSA